MALAAANANARKPFLEVRRASVRAVLATSARHTRGFSTVRHAEGFGFKGSPWRTIVAGNGLSEVVSTSLYFSEE